MFDFDQIRQIAATQHGLVAREQTRELGMSRSVLKRRVDAGYLTFITPRVLKIGGAPESRWQSSMAGVLDAGPDAFASHLTAASLWGVPNVDPEPVNVAVERYIRRNKAPVVIHHLTVIPENQKSRMHNIPVIAPAYTVLLVCGTYGSRKGAQVLDHFLASKDVVVGEVWELVDSLSKQGRNGLCDTRDLLDSRADGHPPAESNNERRLDFLAKEAGIRTLRRQVVVTDPAWIGRVDFEDSELPFVVEVHSERYHTSWAHRRADAERVRRLESAGYTVVVIWDYELWFERDKVIDRLIEARQRARRSAG